MVWPTPTFGWCWSELFALMCRWISLLYSIVQIYFIIGNEVHLIHTQLIIQLIFMWIYPTLTYPTICFLTWGSCSDYAIMYGCVWYLIFHYIYHILVQFYWLRYGYRSYAYSYYLSGITVYRTQFLFTQYVLYIVIYIIVCSLIPF